MSLLILTSYKTMLEVMSLLAPDLDDLWQSSSEFVGEPVAAMIPEVLTSAFTAGCSLKWSSLPMFGTILFLFITRVVL